MATGWEQWVGLVDEKKLNSIVHVLDECESLVSLQLTNSFAVLIVLYGITYFLQFFTHSEPHFLTTVTSSY